MDGRGKTVVIIMVTVAANVYWDKYCSQLHGLTWTHSLVKASRQSCEAGTVTTPVAQMGTQRHREVSNSFRTWWSQESPKALPWSTPPVTPPRQQEGKGS